MSCCTLPIYGVPRLYAPGPRGHPVYDGHAKMAAQGPHRSQAPPLEHTTDDGVQQGIRQPRQRTGVLLIHPADTLRSHIPRAQRLRLRWLHGAGATTPRQGNCKKDKGMEMGA